MSEGEAKKTYETVNSLWKAAKGGDRSAKFCLDFAGYVYTLMEGDNTTDEYWHNACLDLDVLVKRYGDVNCKEADWGRLAIQVADEYHKRSKKGK